MNTFVCLLRGINVGGKNKIRMADLRDLGESLGFSNVRTYLQSGNLVLDHPACEVPEVVSAIERGISGEFKLEVPVIVRCASDFGSIIDDNPFLAQTAIDERKLCVVFLADKPKQADIETIEARDFGDDEFAVKGSHVYLHCPNGYARTKLTNKLFERSFETITTARNWRTVNALRDMA